MTVEESEDAFPVGMRVLAVDDDPTCLKLLEYLLRLCKYHVTTTNQAIVALKLLRENKNKFDLVISDVHMPDMDGFKLLELVGLEMDLPVIMLSANSETKTVMKGIAHGACDYLLKPVRIEELKNIWQHVIRKRKVDSKDYNNFDQGYDSDKLHNGTVEGGQVPSMNDTANQGGKLNRKRKDQNEDEDEDCEENGHDNEDPSTQKRPRVVWSVDLHRKFVAAVNQLGVDKAVPKKILDLMNVEKLTRENVASHLQKYRLYLKRIAASQHANLVATLGGKDSTYLPMASLDGVGDFHSLAGSGQLPDASPSSFQANGVLGRLNCSTGLDFRGVNSSGIFQLSHTHTSGNSSINDLGKLQQATFPVNLHGSLLHGLPISLELDRSHKNKSLPCLNELSAAIDDPTVRPLVQKQLSGSSGFVDTGVTTNYSSHSFGNVSNNPLMLQAQQQQRQCRGLGNQSSVRVEELKQEPFTISVGNATCLPDRGRYNETLQSAVPLTGYSTNSLPLGVPLTHSDLSPSNTRDDLSSITSHIERNPFDASPRNVVAAHLDDLVTRRDLQCQARSVAANMPCVSRDIDENSKFVDFERINNSAGQTMNYDSKKWEDHKQNYANNPNLIFAYSVNSSVPSHGIVDPLGQHLGQNNAIRNRKMDVTLIGQSDFSAPFLMQHSEVGNSTTDNWMKLKEECVLQEAKLQGGFSANSCTPFDDLMNAMIKLEREEATFMGGDIGCDVYPLRTCK